MTGEISTPDGLLIAGPGGEGLELSLRIARPSADPRANRILTGTAREILENDNYVAFGRSVLGQIGLEPNFIGDPYHHKNSHGQEFVRLATEPEGLTELGSAIVDDIMEVASTTEEGYLVQINGQPVRFGRFVNFARLNQLDSDEVREATNTALISFGLEKPDEPGAPKNYRFNDDGSVAIKLSAVEFLINDVPLMKSPEARFNAIRHGRAGLIPYLDSAERNPDEKLDEFLVGGVVMSSGPFYCKIRPAAGNFEQIESASFFDSNRMMGISPTLSPYDRNRQVELMRTKPGEQSYDDTWVTVDFYSDTEASSDGSRLGNWYHLSRTERKRLHSNGIDALDVINAAQPRQREDLFDIAKRDDVAGLVLSRQGVTIAEGGKTPKFGAQNLLKAAINLGTERSIPKGMSWMSDIVKALENAGDRSRVAIAEHLDASDVISLVEQGDVRAFLIKDLAEQAMTKEDHSALVELVRKGIDIGTGGKFYRELHSSGLFMKRDQRDRLDELDMVIAMYGGNKDEVGIALRDNISDFFDDMTDIVPAQRMAVVHGGAGGVMLAADELGREKEIASLGVGMALERLNQDYNENPDGIAKFGMSDRLYRQQMLDTFNTISVFNAGGFGTLEEMFVTTCSHKLRLCLPTPKIAIDETGIYEDATGLIEAISDTEELKVDGQIIDIRDAPLGDKWVKETFHRVESYNDATKIIKDFMADPAAYWRKAGIPEEAISNALQSHLEKLEKVGMSLPRNLLRAAQNYKGPEND